MLTISVHVKPPCAASRQFQTAKTASSKPKGACGAKCPTAKTTSSKPEGTFGAKCPTAKTVQFKTRRRLRRQVPNQQNRQFKTAQTASSKPSVRGGQLAGFEPGTLAVGNLAPKAQRRFAAVPNR
ncbi:MAG TPA: hypothetical protein VMO26_27435 [Vicinamibacterales bacterium]|nr:hypothetical protein [Vicinamibacterales bacterium]